MGKLVFGTPQVRIEMDSIQENVIRNVIDRNFPGVVDRIEEEVEAIYQGTQAGLPEKGKGSRGRATGTTRGDVERGVVVAPDFSLVTGFVRNDKTPYARFVKPLQIGGKSFFVELLRKPAREASARLAVDLAKILAD